MHSTRVYEDQDGIRYKCVGFKNNQYKMQIVDSPISEIQEGIIEWMSELPDVVEKNTELEPVYNPNEGF